MDLWLSMDARGMYVLTENPPVRCEVDATGRDDIFPRPGDGLGLRHLCPAVTEAMFGKHLQLNRFGLVRVALTGIVIGSTMSVQKTMKGAQSR